MRMEAMRISIVAGRKPATGARRGAFPHERELQWERPNSRGFRAYPSSQNASDVLSPYRGGRAFKEQIAITRRRGEGTVAALVTQFVQARTRAIDFVTEETSALHSDRVVHATVRESSDRAVLAAAAFRLAARCAPASLPRAAARGRRACTRAKLQRALGAYGLIGGGITHRPAASEGRTRRARLP